MTNKTILISYVLTFSAAIVGTAHANCDGFSHGTGVPDPRSPEGMRSIVDTSRAAEAIYNIDGKTLNHSLPRSGGGQYKLRPDSFISTPSGMQMAVFQDTASMTAIVAFRGTDFELSLEGLVDWTHANIPSAIDSPSFGVPTRLAPQYSEALDHGLSVISDLSSEGFRIVLTGHSLGGGLAQTVGRNSDSASVVFNTAPAPSPTQEEAGGGVLSDPGAISRHGNTLRVNHTKDPVDYARWDSYEGQIYDLDFNPNPGFIGPHAMSPIVDQLEKSLSNELPPDCDKLDDVFASSTQLRSGRKWTGSPPSCQGALVPSDHIVATIRRLRPNMDVSGFQNCVMQEVSEIEDAYEALENAKCVFRDGMEEKEKMYLLAGLPIWWKNGERTFPERARIIENSFEQYIRRPVINAQKQSFSQLNTALQGIEACISLVEDSDWYTSFGGQIYSTAHEYYRVGL